MYQASRYPLRVHALTGARSYTTTRSQLGSQLKTGLEGRWDHRESPQVSCNEFRSLSRAAGTSPRATNSKLVNPQLRRYSSRGLASHAPTLQGINPIELSAASDAPAVTIRPPGVLDTNFATEAVLLIGWVLDKPVDAEKVQAAWEALNTAWPILSARLRYDKKTKKWEYHIPTKPCAHGFASLSISDSMDKHYQPSQPSDKIRCTPKPSPLHLFQPRGPRSMKDIVNADRPVCHLHVTTFNDASLLSFSVPHIVCDAGGLAAVARGLESIINGGPPPPPLSSHDPFAAYAQKASEDVPAPPNWRVTSPLETVSVYARGICTELFGAKMENRDIFFPKDEVKRIKAEAMEDIRRDMCAHASQTSSAPLNVFYTTNFRDHFNLPSHFPHNAVAYVATDAIPLSSMAKLPLGNVALNIRKTVATQSEKPAIERWIRWRLVNEGKIQICFDPWRGAWQIATNWREMNLLNIDFSGALPDGELKQSGKLRSQYLWMDGLGPVLRNWIGLIADEPSGGMWMAGTFAKKTWEDPRGFGRFIDTKV
ncbi:hypothetical protein BD779DRAFT_1538339 [Infundibulicybe gibba]|nr:hypothetical protein BD779DRAFT_1538339 [Infundibulicybe gibba]